MPEIRIGDRLVGDGHPVYVIAEAGINHNGSLELAKMLVDVAADAGADCVKFQKRHLPSVYSRRLLEDPNREGQQFQFLIPLLEEVELSESDYHQIVEHCRARGITFLCTPWDTRSADFLDELGVPAFKIASADMTNLELLEHCASKGKPLIVSTGMSRMEEIERTVEFLRSLGAEFMLMHCTSTYPTAARDVNLRMIETLRRFGVPVGYSGHERGIVLTAVAAALGACCVERHFTLDRTMRGPDHAASIEPEGLARLVKYIRTIEVALGDGVKRFTRGEGLMRECIGKSIVARVPIPAGTTITREMLTVKSPGRGLSPQVMERVIGMVASRDIGEEEVILPSHLEGWVDEERLESQVSRY